jgi:hypothetical protein
MACVECVASLDVQGQDPVAFEMFAPDQPNITDQLGRMGIMGVNADHVMEQLRRMGFAAVETNEPPPVQAQVRNNRTKEVYTLTSGERFPFPNLTPEDFMALLITFDELMGVWWIGGMRLCPTMTTLFRGTAVCASHLLLMKARESMGI